MTDTAQNVPVKPAAHSIGTQTSQPPSAAAAFLIRSVNATPQRAAELSAHAAHRSVWLTNTNVL